MEEIFELDLLARDTVAMQCRQPSLEGTGEISLRRLVKEALRMRPDRLVVGEVREAESLDLLIALNSGIPGMCSIHANTRPGCPRQAVHAAAAGRAQHRLRLRRAHRGERDRHRRALRTAAQRPPAHRRDRRHDRPGHPDGGGDQLHLRAAARRARGHRGSYPGKSAKFQAARRRPGGDLRERRHDPAAGLRARARPRARRVAAALAGATSPARGDAVRRVPRPTRAGRPPSLVERAPASPWCR